MSYILDALKRADAERERGHVPGLHSQSADAHSTLPRRASRRPSATVLGLAGLCLLLGAAVGLWWFGRAPVPPAEPATTAAPTAAAPAVTAPPAADTPITTAAPLPTQPVNTPAEPVPPILVPEPPPAPPAAEVRTAAPPPAADGRRDAPVTRFADLPPELRAQLPQLNVSGASYSSDPAHRLLIVNGKVAHEGQEIAPGLLLEQIGLHQSVLSHRGTRFSITH